MLKTFEKQTKQMSKKMKTIAAYRESMAPKESQAKQWAAVGLKIKEMKYKPC